jgi:hypothetical protein
MLETSEMERHGAFQSVVGFQPAVDPSGGANRGNHIYLSGFVLLPNDRRVQGSSGVIIASSETVTPGAPF